MNVREKPNSHGFQEYAVCRQDIFSEEGQLKIAAGMWFKDRNEVAVSECGKYWCYVEIRARNPPSYNVITFMEGLDVIRAHYSSVDSKVVTLHITPRLTVLAGQMHASELLELSLDGVLLRHIPVVDTVDKGFTVMSTRKFIFTASRRNTVRTYKYASGEHVSTAEIQDADTFKYSPFTGRVYTLSWRKSVLQTLCITPEGSLVKHGEPWSISPTLIFSNHWDVVHGEQVVLLKPYENQGICFRGMSLSTEQFGNINITAIPGGFMLVAGGIVRFVMDRFTFTCRETFMQACVM